MKKIFALLLCAAMLVCMFAGCSDENADPVVSPSGVTDDLDATPSASAGTDTETPSRDYQKALDSISADTVMATVGGLEITWDEMFYWLYNNITYLENGLGVVEDWSKEMADGMTYSDFFIEYSLNSAVYYRALELKAQELSITLDEETETAIQTSWDSFVEEKGGDAATDEYLTSQYCNRNIYQYIMKCQGLKEALFVNQFGLYGANLADADVLEYVKDDGYMMAKHILLTTVDEDDNPLSDEEKEEKYQQAEEILGMLQAYEGDDLSGYFSELIEEYGEDPGTSVFTHGYLFQSGDMVEEFENAVTELEENAYSGIVESPYGYHIILRLPIDVDVIPSAYANYAYSGYTYSLRFIVAWDMFSALATEWQDACTVETTDALNNLKLGELFAE